MDILVVEDEPMTSYLLQNFFEERGHVVTLVADGESGLAIFLKQDFPIVIVDLNLPVMDGLELCRRIRKTKYGWNSLILVNTIRKEAGELQQVMDAGADDYLTKPIDYDLLNIRFSIAIQRVTNRRRLKLAETELRISAVAFDSRESMMITDDRCIILQVNQAFTEETGYTAEEIIGKTPKILQSRRHDAAFYQEMWKSINETGKWQGEIWQRRKNGELHLKWLTISSVKDADGTVTHYVGSHFDITERKASEEQILHLVFYDALTNLPNRRLLSERLDRALLASKRNGCQGALMLLDLDNFKSLNDTHGHHAGDLLLVEVGQRIKACLRDFDTVARLGGDEFVILLNELSADSAESLNEAKAVAEKVHLSLFNPYRLTDKQEHMEITLVYQCTASIGVVVFTNGETTQNDIMKKADAAMYQAKNAGRNQIVFITG